MLNSEPDETRPEMVAARIALTMTNGNLTIGVEQLLAIEPAAELAVTTLHLVDQLVRLQERKHALSIVHQLVGLIERYTP